MMNNNSLPARNPESFPRAMIYWQWRILLATMACYLFYYCGRLNLQICLKPIADEFGWDKGRLGLLATAFIWTYGIGQLINGTLADRFGRILMLLGALVSCAVNWAFSFSPLVGKSVAGTLGWENAGMAIFSTMVLFWMTNAFFQAMGMAPGGRLISNWWGHEQRGLAMGLYAFAAAMANVTVFLLASYAADQWGWRAAFRYPVLLMAGMAVFFYFVTRDRPEQAGLPSPNPPPPDTRRTSRSLERWGLAFRDRRFVLACGSIALHHIVRYGMLTFVPIFLMESYGWKIDKTGFVSSALPLGMAVGAVSGGYISDRIFRGRRKPIIAISLILCAVCVLGFLMLPKNAATVGQAAGNAAALPGSLREIMMMMLLVLGYMVYLGIGPYFSLPADLLGAENAGTGIGVLDACAYAGAGAGTIAVGYLIEYLGYSAGFLFIAGCPVAGAALILLMREPDSSSRCTTRPLAAARGED